MVDVYAFAFSIAFKPAASLWPKRHCRMMRRTRGTQAYTEESCPAASTTKLLVFLEECQYIPGPHVTQEWIVGRAAICQKSRKGDALSACTCTCTFGTFPLNIAPLLVMKRAKGADVPMTCEPGGARWSQASTLQRSGSQRCSQSTGPPRIHDRSLLTFTTIIFLPLFCNSSSRLHLSMMVL
jgi:hypothetical protein